MRKFASDVLVRDSRRLTNLFARPSPVALQNRFLEERLIHRSGKGEPMRSKSEVIIANELAAAGVDYEYELRFVRRRRAKTRWPDFTIQATTPAGHLYLWEHCGMLSVPEYAERWQRKREWYVVQGVQPLEAGGGDRAALIVTEDDESGGIDSYEIKQKIAEIFG